MIGSSRGRDATRVVTPAAGAVEGVLAYGKKPVQRKRPNERFLQATLRDIGTCK
jgi:hypothetical protein